MLARLDDAIADMRKVIAAKDWDGYRQRRQRLPSRLPRGIRQSLSVEGLSSDIDRARGAARAAAARRGQLSRTVVQRALSRSPTLLRDGKVDDAATLLSYHILVINELLHTFPLELEQGLAQGQGGRPRLCRGVRRGGLAAPLRLNFRPWRPRAVDCNKTDIELTCPAS